MKQSTSAFSAKHLLLTAICIVLASTLLIAAFFEPKRPAEGEWVQLGRAVEDALDTIENTDGGELAEAEKGAAGEVKADTKNADTTVNKSASGAAAEAGAEAEGTGKSSAEAAAGAEESGKTNAEAGAAAEAEKTSAEEGSVSGEAAIKDAEAGMDDGKLDINHATAAELDSLKGIGPAKAQAIVDDRELNGPYAAVDDLLRVKGIGEKLLAGIKESIVARS